MDTFIYIFFIINKLKSFTYISGMDRTKASSLKSRKDKRWNVKDEKYPIICVLSYKHLLMDTISTNLDSCKCNDLLLSFLTEVLTFTWGHRKQMVLAFAYSYSWVQHSQLSTLYDRKQANKAKQNSLKKHKWKVS